MELMIVIAIMALLMAILVPALLHSRTSASENAVLLSMKAFALSETTHSRDHGQFTTIQELSNKEYLVVGGQLEPGFEWSMNLVQFRKSGYLFAFQLINDSQFTLTGVPEVWGDSGSVNLYVDASGVVRYNEVEGQLPTVNDPAWN